MSDKPQRTMEEVNREYQQLCARAGQCQYQITTLQKDLEAFNASIRDLNLEAAALKPAPVAATPTEGDNKQ